MNQICGKYYWKHSMYKMIMILLWYVKKRVIWLYLTSKWFSFCLVRLMLKNVWLQLIFIMLSSLAWDTVSTFTCNFHLWFLFFYLYVNGVLLMCSVIRCRFWSCVRRVNEKPGKSSENKAEYWSDWRSVMLLWWCDLLYMKYAGLENVWFLNACRATGLYQSCLHG